MNSNDSTIFDRLASRLRGLCAPVALLSAGLALAGVAQAQEVLGFGAHSDNVVGGQTGSGVAIGYFANGDSTNPGGSSPVAIGSKSNASGAGSQVAIGDHSVATGNGAVAIGGHTYTAGTQATGDYSVAMGSMSSATGTGALAFGGDKRSGATASGNYAVAFGAQALASQANAFAVGTGAQALNANDVALGAGSVSAAAASTVDVTINGNTYGFAGTSPASTVSIGDISKERTLTNLAAGRIGASSTDAVNGSQLNATNLALAAEDVKVNTFGGSVTAALGGGATFDPLTGAMTSPVYNVYGQQVTGVANTIAALQNFAPLQYSTAAAPTTGLGANGLPVSNDVTLVGPNAGAPVTLHNVAAGVAATDAVNVSQLAIVNDRLNTFGGSVTAALGGGAVFDPLTGAMTSPVYNVYGQPITGVENTVAALQNGAPVQYSTAAAPTTGLGANGAPVSNDVTLVGPDASAPVALHNVAAGIADTDAVNVSQLNSAIDGLVINVLPPENVSWIAVNPADSNMPSATGVDATAAGSGSVASGEQSTAMGTNSVASGAQSTAIGANANASANNSVALGANSVADQANTVSVGSAGGERRVTNVAPGVDGTDAVNVNQLNARAGALQNQIGDNLKKSYAGSAAAIAIAGLRYDDRPGKISAAAAAGYYHSQMGLAMGVGGTSDDGRWRVNGGITVTPTLSSPDVGAVVGVSHTFN